MGRAKQPKRTAVVAMVAVSETEGWSDAKKLALAIEFIDNHKLGNELFVFLEEKASLGEQAVDSEE